MNQETIEFNTFWGHAEDLRKTFARSILLILSATFIALFFYQEIFHFLESPLQKASDVQKISLKKEQIINNSLQEKIITLSENSYLLEKSETSLKLSEKTFKLPPKAFLIVEKPENRFPLVILSPIDGMITVLKTCFFIGLLISSPFWGFLILNFLAPALNFAARELIISFILFSFLFISLGIAFAFFITIPLANNYLMLFNEGIGTNFWTLSHYIDYTLLLALGNGISFESAVIAIFLVHYGFLTSTQMQSKRRHFIVAAFIIGALLTPPDVLTQFMLAIPLIILYEFIILYAKFLKTSK